ncbi:hypothetical protein GA0115236_12208 [Streptomyces sp. IgraMP-1]|nr:hypothetical protein GA0115236_12208 [Streptomyces sp. IgraMP-1]
MAGAPVRLETTGTVGAWRGESGDDRAELLQHRVHERRVERVGDPQPAGAAPEGRDAGGDGLDGVLGSGDDDRGRAVDGGDGDLSGVFGDERRDLVLGGLQGDHGAALVQRLHEAATGGDQGAGVGEGEHPGDVGGGYLADGVAGEVVGGDAPGLDEPVQGHFEGEQGGLRVLGAVEERGLLAALLGEDQGLQRAVEPRVEVLQDLVEGAGEDGEAGVKVAAHAGTLGALAREEHGELGTATQLVGGETRGVRTGGERGEDGDGGVLVGGGEGRAVLQGGAGGGERVGDVQGGRRGPGGEVVEEPGGLGAQGLGGTAGEQPGQRPGVDGRGGLAVGGRLLGSLLDDGVRVGAGEAEGGDARATRRVLAGRPGGGLRQQADGALAPVDVGGGPVDMEGARQQAVAHRHDHLDDARDTRRGLGVADVGLDRAEQQRVVGLAALAVGGQQRLGLDGVAEDRAGAVCLDGVDVGGGEPGVDQGGLDDALLGGAVGGGQAVGGTVLVDGGPPDHGEDAVAVAAGLGEPLQDEDADTLGPAGAVGGVGEGPAAPVGGEAALAGELDEGGGAGHDGDTGGQGQGALPRAQRLGGQVQGHQGGGAGGVDGHGRSDGTEEVGEPPGEDAGGVAGELEALDVVVGADPVVLGHGADEHAGAAAAYARGVDAGPFEGLPAGLQEQALLRVHGQSLAGRDAEEVRVEGGRVVQEAAGEVGGALAERGLPATVLGHAGDAVLAGDQHLPQVLGAAHPAGVAAAHADDRDGLGGRRLQLGHPLPGALQIGARPLQVVPELLFLVHINATHLDEDRRTAGGPAWTPGARDGRRGPGRAGCPEEGKGRGAGPWAACRARCLTCLRGRPGRRSADRRTRAALRHAGGRAAPPPLPGSTRRARVPCPQFR